MHANAPSTLNSNRWPGAVAPHTPVSFIPRTCTDAAVPVRPHVPRPVQTAHPAVPVFLRPGQRAHVDADSSCGDRHIGVMP